MNANKKGAMTGDVDAFVRELQVGLVACSSGGGRGPVVDAVRILKGRVVQDLVVQIDYHDPVTGKTYSDTLAQFGELLSSMGDDNPVGSLAGVLWSGYHEALYALPES